MGSLRTLVLAALAALVAAASAHAQVPPADPIVAGGVTIAGVDVGGMTGDEATAAVQAFFAQPISVSLGPQTLSLQPSRLGGRAHVAEAVTAALAAPAGATLDLRVTVRRGELRGWVNRRARAFERKPVAARVRLDGLRPSIVAPKPGRRLVREGARTRLRAALLAHRLSARLPVRKVKAAVTARNVGPAVVIRRDSRRLFFYKGFSPGKMRLARSFPVAVGQPAWPTPLGSFVIRSMRKNPWWYPPDESWAEGAEPIPPGPGNPLGTRWMGLSIGGVGIHGTYNSGSIGTAASHGCIRMHISSAEWLYERVGIGNAVFIVGA
jgi:lipoprotein-anchoring transpeptidase ErfK/SrfK